MVVESDEAPVEIRAECAFGAALSFAQQGRLAEAAEFWRRALEVEPLGACATEAERIRCVGVTAQN